MTTDADYAELVATARTNLATAIARGDEPDGLLAGNGAEGLGILNRVAFWRDRVRNLEVLAFADGTGRVEGFGGIMFEERWRDGRQIPRPSIHGHSGPRPHP